MISGPGTVRLRQIGSRLSFSWEQLRHDQLLGSIVAKSPGLKTIGSMSLFAWQHRVACLARSRTGGFSGAFSFGYQQRRMNDAWRQQSQELNLLNPTQFVAAVPVVSTRLGGTACGKRRLEYEFAVGTAQISGGFETSQT
jgi:hypothetical protein